MFMRMWNTNVNKSGSESCEQKGCLGKRKNIKDKKLVSLMGFLEEFDK